MNDVANTIPTMRWFKGEHDEVGGEEYIYCGTLGATTKLLLTCA